MSDELLINVMPAETRAALLRDGVLVELFVEHRARESRVGNIYLGRVEKIIGGMNAAFVNIGIGRAGFLSADAARETFDFSGSAATPRIGDFVTEGQTITVQVVKDAIGSKGVQLARRLSLPGRFLVYTPTESRVSVSRQIAGEAEQARLTGMIRKIVQPGEGFILRTAAEGAEASDLIRDAGHLRVEWAALESRRGRSSAPAPIRTELGPVERVLRDHVDSGMTAIRIDNDGGLAAAQLFCERFFPDAASRLVRYSEPEPLFEAFDVEAEIERALSPHIGLDSGGGIVIEATEALTAIDVNSGSLVNASSLAETSRRTNLEAAAEIARQVRLRGIAGLIIVDFIHMEDAAAWRQIIETLESGFAGDRNSPRILGRTAAGLVEITRRRRRESLAQLMTERCILCAGAGRIGTPRSVAHGVMRALVREAAQSPPGTLIVTAAADVVDTLQGDAAPALGELVRNFGRKVALRSEAGYQREQFDIFTERERADER